MADKKYSAAIYCGHGLSTDGSFDPGCTYDGMTEAALMLPITKAFVKYARSSGITVYTDVDAGENNNMNAVKQIREANAKNVDVFVSLHCDWYKAPTGTMPLYCKGSTKGKKLAECLNKYVEEMTGIDTRGVTARTDLGELNQTEMEACIFETGSIKADRKEWDTEKECDEYGKALAKGLCYYFGISFKEPVTEKKETKTETKKPATTKTTTKKETNKVVIPKKVKSKVVTASIKKKGKSYKVTDHFTLGEFQCNNGADTVKYDKQTVTALEAARLFFNVPISISSAYRPADYNKKVGGAPGSYHVKGRAVDHYCKLSFSLLAKFYEVYGLKGIGCYYDDHFVHIDSRVTKFYWQNQSSTAVSTHLVTVKIGNDNRHVSDLQWVLKHKHGFKALKVDGEFGMATKTAVVEFQKKHKLTPDSIVGKKTWKKLLAI